MSGAIVILSDKNDSAGNLSQIALSRAKKAHDVYQRLQGTYKLLPTGGKGVFNRTDTDHGLYLMRHLRSLGADSSDILQHAESRTHHEDALFSKAILDRHKVKTIIVITSDYLLRRTKLIFRSYYPDDYAINFLPTPTAMNVFERLQHSAYDIPYCIGLALGNVPQYK